MNPSYVAQEIKDRVTMREIAEHYGLEVNRAGFASCPFHRERTPSLKVYERSFHCFGCGETGDQIDFVRKIDGVDFNTACARINEAFALGLPIGQKTTPNQEREAARRAFIRRKERNDAKMAAEQAEMAYWAAYDAWLYNLQTIEKNTPMNELEPISAEYAEAVAKEALLEWQLSLAEDKLYQQNR